MDMLLDEDSNDLIYINGQAPVTNTQLSTVSQRLKVRLQTFLGEYFINNSTGVPYYQNIFGKIRNKSTVDTIFQSQILADEGVIEIISYRSTLDASTRYLEVTFTVRTSEGVTQPITINIGA